MKRGPALFLLVPLFVLAVLSASANAQTLSAHTLADRIDHHYNSLRSLQLDFTQNYAGMGMNRRESGVLLLKKPGRMRWTYSNPAGKLFVLDGRNAYFYSPGDSTAQRVPAKDLNDLRSPLRLLLGHTKLEKEMNNLAISPNADGTWTLTGIPRGLEKRVSSFSLTANTEGVIQSMQIDETDGVRNTFTFTNQQPNAPAPNSDFVFTPPAGVTIVTGMPPV